ncbi:MAG: serine acetyltransferase [Lachnospiraceae bacterium]|nr:serine acetyltransferase [Lachnospiraceae bacterium]
MIDSKEKYKYYLQQDRIALGRSGDKRPKLFGDETWKFEILLRKLEYYMNCRKDPIGVIIRKWYSFRFHRLSIRLGFVISPNVFEGGLSIPHYGTLVVHANAKVGKNCRLLQGTAIVADGGSHDAALVGDNCFFGVGAKVVGAVRIADDVAVGAGAVVTKDITEAGTTWVGVPARKISDNNSHSNLCQALFQK